ncbi:MAG: PQQ-binding-like beta-propeller repeat protein, partial [Cyclobacteriaceae bacterium]|nr:PQQ-binding-like beta-propeller repeat protein [Cyclobacteriaceae bacterium]
MFNRFTLFAILIVSALSVSGQIQNPKIRWKFKTQGTIRGTASIKDDKVYIGSADGFLYALNKSSGELAWKFQTQGAVSATPTVANDLIIFTSRDNYVYSVNVSTGKLVWKFQMQPIIDAYWEWEYFTSTPVVNKNVVYVGSGDSHMYALALDNGKLIWKAKTNGRIRATPLIHNNTIYQPSDDGVVYAIQADTGKPLWTFKTDGAALDSRKYGFDRTCIFAKPLLRDSLLFIASRDGKVYGVNIHTQREKWRFTYGATWAMATNLDNETLYVGWSTNNHVCALDAVTGKEKWKFIGKGICYTTPLILEHEIVIGSGDENLYALDRVTGQKKWSYALPAPIFSSPVMDANIIYVGCDDGNLYAIEEGTKALKAVYSPVPGKFDFTVDSKITPFLKSRGFLHLDSAGLTKFLSDRIHDQAPSVIVMAYDYFPTNVIGENPEKGMVRQYLESGGKIIWFGNIPNLYSFDKEGKPNK